MKKLQIILITGLTVVCVFVILESYISITVHNKTVADLVTKQSTPPVIENPAAKEAPAIESPVVVLPSLVVTDRGAHFTMEPPSKQLPKLPTEAEVRKMISEQMAEQKRIQQTTQALTQSENSPKQ